MNLSEPSYNISLYTDSILKLTDFKILNFQLNFNLKKNDDYF